MGSSFFIPTPTSMSRDERNLTGAILVYFTIGQASPIQSGSPSKLSPRTALAMHLSNSSLRAAFAIGFCILFAFIGTFTFVNFVLIRPPIAIGMMTLGFVFFVFLPSILTTPLAGKAVVRLGTRKTMWGALGLAGLGVPLMLTANLAVIDITGSMNVRDYHLDGHPVSRLDMMKDTLRQLLTALPCGSQLGLAIFTERRPFLLFEPVEVCGNFEALDRAIAALDWRMAWEGDSHIASGFYRSVALAGDLDADLIFISDGQEAPPLPWVGRPRFEGKTGLVKGLIVGAGGYDPSPIPKFDEFGRETGFWRPRDVPNENVNAPPPPGADEREGFNPRNAPFGGTAVSGHEYLSSVDEAHLKKLASETGLSYRHFEGFQNFMSSLEDAAKPRGTAADADIKWIPAAVSLAFLLMIYGVLPILDRQAAGLPLFWRPRWWRRRPAARSAMAKATNASSRLIIAAFALLQASASVHGEPADLLARGAYLVKITGCAGCHSPRTETGGLNTERLLSGGDHPIAAGGGVRIYPPNLTPDAETGIKGWSVEDIVKVLKTGTTPDGRVLSTAMPWRTQSNQLEEADAQAIALYLKSLPAIANRVPPPLSINTKPAP
jgi:mxaL protein